MMNREVFVFLVMVVCGGAISMLFDLFRACRIEIKPPDWAVAVSDVLFCAISVFFIVACVWNFNSGIFRFYEIIGLVLGGVFYFSLLSKWILRLFLFIIENILKFVKLILKILLTPWLFLYKILIVPIQNCIRKTRQRSHGTYAERIQEQNH